LFNFTKPSLSTKVNSFAKQHGQEDKNKMQQKTPFKAYAAMTASVIFWGLSYVGTKFALNGFSPLMLAFLRFAIAGLLFALVLLSRNRIKTSLTFHRKVAGIAFFLPGLYFIFENFGIKYTTATKASMIIAMVPVAVSLLSVLLLGEKLTSRRILSLFLSLGGVYLLLLYGKTGSLSLQMSVGDLLMFGAVFAAAAYMLLTRKLCAEYDSFLVTAYQMIYGALFFTPFFIWEFADTNWLAISGQQWVALLVLALLSSVGAFLTYNYALKSVPTSRASLFVNIVPLVTVLASWLLLGEILQASQICGGLLVIAAACLATNRENVPAERRTETLRVELSENR
jgi:drug/metabolite transporter (DMT)-like permease